MSSPLHISTSHQSRPKAYAPVSPVVSSPYKLARDAQKMSVTQAYFLAHKARAKLSSEAARPDHNLRLLVGHANLLDSLMLDLAEAEREQESWFNQSVRGATKSDERHIQWADSIVEQPEHDWQAEDADSDSDSDSDFSDEEEDDVEMADVVALRRIPSHTVKDFGYDMEDDDYEDDEEDFAELALQRSPSHSASPPELDHDSDTSEDESMPPSPPTVVMPTFSDKPHDYHYSAQQETYSSKDAFYEEGFYLPARNPARLVSAY